MEDFLGWEPRKDAVTTAVGPKGGAAGWMRRAADRWWGRAGQGREGPRKDSRGGGEVIGKRGVHARWGPSWHEWRQGRPQQRHPLGVTRTEMMRIAYGNYLPHPHTPRLMSGSSSLQLSPRSPTYMTTAVAPCQTPHLIPTFALHTPFPDCCPPCSQCMYLPLPSL